MSLRRGCRIFDWTDEDFEPRVRNQGRENYCMPCVVAVVVEGMAYANGDDDIYDLSEQQLIDGFRDIDHENRVHVKTFLKYCSNVCLTTTSSYPLNLVNGTYVKQDFQANLVRSPKICVGGWRKLEATSDEDMETVMVKAVKQQPLFGLMRTTPELLLAYKSTGIYDTDYGGDMDFPKHAVVIMGFGVSRRSRKYWNVLFSSGENWGNNGFIRVLRGAGGNGLCGIERVAFVPFPPVPIPPVPIPPVIDTPVVIHKKVRDEETEKRRMKGI